MNLNKTLINSISLFKNLAQYSRDAFWIRDKNYTSIIYVNDAYEQIYSSSSVELTQNPDLWQQTVHSEDISQLNNQLKKWLKESSTQADAELTLNYRLKLQNGQIRSIKERIQLMYIDGQHHGYSGIATDVTALNQDQILQDNSGYYLNAFSQQLSSVFWIRDLAGRQQHYVSPAYVTIWGRSCDSLIKNPEKWIETLHPDDRNANDMQLRVKNTKNGIYKQYINKYRIIRPNGEIRWIKDSNFPIYDHNQKLIAHAGIAEDITKETLHEQRLKNITNIAKEKISISNYYFNAFSQEFNSVFWVRNLTGTKQYYVSPAYEKIWGRSCASLIDNPNSWLDSLHPDDQIKNNMQHRVDNTKKGLYQHYENKFRIIRPDGETRWIKDTNFTIRDDNNELIAHAGIAEDITKDVIREKKLKQATQKAELASQAKTKFLAELSHELRTPLNAIIGSLQIINNQSDANSEYLDIMLKSSQHLLSLVSELLDIASIESNKIVISSVELNLESLIRDLIQESLNQVNTNNISLHMNFDPKTPKEIYGDTARLRQVISNLLSNAIKFTNQGGVTIYVNCEPISYEMRCFTIQVKDTGIGIKQEDQQIIFEQFEQVVNQSNNYINQRGLGLGLSIAKELTEAMGGTISVKSSFGIGTEFSIRLPLKIQCPKRNNACKEMLGHTSAPSRRESDHLLIDTKILLIEDDRLSQLVAAKLLSDLGGQVDIAESGAQALATDITQYKIIFIDIGLPDTSGIELARKIRQRQDPNTYIPIIALTAHVYKKDQQECLRAGIDEVLLKPIMLDNLKDTLARWIMYAPSK